MIRCIICGRFISYRDISLGFCKHEYTPDTAFSSEDDSWYCRKCIDKEKEENMNGKE